MNPFQSNKTEDDGTNLPLPDRLKEVRMQLAAMNARKAEISLEITEKGSHRGAFVEAVVSKETRRSLDIKAVKAHYGDELDQFYRKTEVVKIKLNEIDSE
jgi:hypothetical protein